MIDRALLVRKAFAADNHNTQFTDADYAEAVKFGGTEYLHPIVDAVLEALAGMVPRGNFRPDFEVGDEVEYRSGGYSGNPEVLRPAVVTGLDVEFRTHTFLRVKFDDNSEERQINPDVMRRRREKK